MLTGYRHGGLAISAYLKAFDIDFAVIDREAEVGDAWAKASLV